MKPILILALVLLAHAAYCQQPISNNRKITIGAELDALPYITGGYYGSVWAGRNHMRYRVVLAKVKMPDFFVAEGFTNNKIQACAAIADYFFRPGFEKLWIGAGVEYWRQSIQTDAKLSTATYNNAVLTIGTGYVWKFYRNFYLNPWAALHARAGGNNKVTVDDREYNPPLVAGEVSLKIGYHL